MPSAMRPARTSRPDTQADSDKAGFRPQQTFLEAQFPGVRNCTRMQARRHGYRLLTSDDPGAARLGENVLMVRRH